jgi:hypothetical protein
MFRAGATWERQSPDWRGPTANWEIGVPEAAGFRHNQEMRNPWLNIPLADYEGHMSSAEVQQLDAPSELFAAALERCQPTSVAVLGVAGGNGLDRIDIGATRRVVGLDLNPLYLNEVRNRYGGSCNLELHCVDLAQQRVELEPVQLVHAALVFEHAGVDRCLENAVSLVEANGALSVVLQLRSEVEQAVGISKFPSMLKLKNHFSFVDPFWLRRELANSGLRIVHEAQRSVPAGKLLWMGVFGRS